uniref:Transposase n=1 Tax=Heterorhabditis bacteriophora TaxID=37862 RepID=A0A1I7WAE7_HETBA
MNITQDYGQRGKSRNSLLFRMVHSSEKLI